ncbi:glutamine--fructose-6-phosphate transaminase (isomerizing) [Candidatus Woesearchaeota archaeon]|nr:glutamine--fructose-6-phosphate transaminase (isomerizing) [Candidatus Woesearchaeota archaeon]
MCGIMAYIGNGNAASVVVNGLKKLEYRGYDSWGIALLSDAGIEVVKKVGKIGDFSGELNKCSTAIAQTRWATHGGVNERNAHPHLSCDKTIAVVHNGIIENYNELKAILEEKHKFVSQTDTEVIPHLIEDELKNNGFEEAVRRSLARLEGTFAVAVLNKGCNEIICARKGSPLVIGLGDGELFAASDVTAFLEHTKKAIFMEDDEMAVLGKAVKITNFVTNKEINKKIDIIEWDVEQAQKGNYEHFMLKEICEQPGIIEDNFRGRIRQDSVVFDELRDFDIGNFSRIVITACGTALYAGMVGEYLFEELVKIPVETEYASEFRYRDPIIDEKTLVIAITQSGETADTLGAVREAKSKKAFVLSIVNVVGSTIARESDIAVYTRAGPEIGVASTKAFTSQLTVLYLLALYFSEKLALINNENLKEKTEELKKIPLMMKEILDDEDIKKCALKYCCKNNFLYLGRGANYPIAMEGALKLKEISYIHAEGQSAAEMKHGPIALIDNNMPAVFIAVKDNTYAKIISNIEEVKARGGIVIAITGNDGKEAKQLADYFIEVPSTNALLQPILNVVPLQLFAYYIADIRGCDIDKPRNLAKSVTVE